MVSAAKKKLLVLDVNGLLLDTYFKNDKLPYCHADGMINNHHVYRRPYCNDFIEFCFENFEMGIWSSSKEHNVEGFINFIFGDLKSKLLFTWHQADCTDTGLKTPGNRYKPVFLKELSKLWNKVKPDLPWEKGDFGPSNTLLIDDSPYKALRNPPYTAVFPDPYKVSNNFDDSLGGALRKYLEGLATASNVQCYVKHHPFGQPPISKENPYWNFYRKILLPMEDSAPYMEEEENDMANAAIPNLEKSVPSENREDGLRNGNVQHSELSPCIGKRQKKHRNHPVTGTNQSSVPIEEEDNGVFKVAVLNMEECKSSENKKGNLQSGNGPQSESSSQSGKHKKRRKNHLGTSTNQSSVPGMEEDNNVINMAMLNTEKSISSENIRDNLQSGNGLQSEVSSRSSKPEKRRKDHLSTSTNQSSVPSMEEENGVVNMAMLNVEKSVSLENRKGNLQSGNGQQSESSSWSGKRKRRQRDCPFTGNGESSFLGKQKVENGVAEMEMPDEGKSRSITQDLLSQEHESCRIHRGYKNAKLLYEHRKPSETGLPENSSFCNHKSKHKRFQNASVSRGSAPALEDREGGIAEAMDISTRKGYGTTVASFGQEAVVAQTDKAHCDNKPYTKFRDHNGFRYGNKGHHYKPAHFSPDPHMNFNRWSSNYCQRDSQASYFPGRQFQAERGHNKGFDPSIHTRVKSNFPPHPLKGYINDGQDRWQMHNGFHLQHVYPCQSHNPSHMRYPVCQSYNTNLGATEFRGPLMQHQFQLQEQMYATDYSTQYQGYGRNFRHCKNNFRSKHG